MLMKRICLLLSLLILLITNVFAEDYVKYFELEEPLTFGNTEFNFAWSARPYDFYFTQEYLPKGESFDSYTQMLTITVLMIGDAPLDSKKAIQMKIEELEQRKATDKVCDYIVVEKEDKCILDFIVSDGNGDKLNCVEVDIQYIRDTIINGIKAQVLYFYSCRAYGDEILPFMKSIPEQKAKWYEEIIKYDIPLLE